MSNQDLKAVPTDEQAAALAHHNTLMKEVAKHLALCRSTPEGITPEVAKFFEDLLAAEVQWLAAQGILFPGVEGGGQ